MRYLIFFTALLIIFLSSSSLKTQAASITLALDPTSGAHNVGDEFPVAIILNTNNQPIIGADARVSFNPQLLEVKTITEGGANGNYVKNSDNQNGVATVSVFSLTPFVLNNRNLVTLTFQVKAGGTANVNLVFDPQDKMPDSSVAVQGQTTDQLNSVASAVYILTGSNAALANPTATLAPTIPSPTPVVNNPNPIASPTLEPPTATPTVLKVGSPLPDTGVNWPTYLLLITALFLLFTGSGLLLR